MLLKTKLTPNQVKKRLRSAITSPYNGQNSKTGLHLPDRGTNLTVQVFHQDNNDRKQPIGLKTPLKGCQNSNNT